jgi:hypothetical protein
MQHIMVLMQHIMVLMQQLQVSVSNVDDESWMKRRCKCFGTLDWYAL